LPYPYAAFSCDSFAHCTGKTINASTELSTGGTTTNFVYDGLNPVQEKNALTVMANLLPRQNFKQLMKREWRTPDWVRK